MCHLSFCAYFLLEAEAEAEAEEAEEVEEEGGRKGGSFLEENMFSEENMFA